LTTSTVVCAGEKNSMTSSGVICLPKIEDTGVELYISRQHMNPSAVTEQKRPHLQKLLTTSLQVGLLETNPHRQSLSTRNLGPFGPLRRPVREVSFVKHMRVRNLTLLERTGEGQARSQDSHEDLGQHVDNPDFQLRWPRKVQEDVQQL
jgi:hypothetical protein